MTAEDRRAIFINIK